MATASSPSSSNPAFPLLDPPSPLSLLFSIRFSTKHRNLLPKRNPHRSASLSGSSAAAKPTITITTIIIIRQRKDHEGYTNNGGKHFTRSGRVLPLRTYLHREAAPTERQSQRRGHPPAGSSACGGRVSSRGVHEIRRKRQRFDLG